MSKGVKTSCGLFVIALLIFGFPAARLAGAQGAGGSQQGQGGGKAEQPGEQFVAGRLLVKFRDDVPSYRAQEIAAARGAWVTDEIAHIGVRVLQLPAGASEQAELRAFQSRREVEFAELDRLLPPEAMTPNDPWYANWEWHLTKISAPLAWSTTTGASSITIAILDSGIESTHEDLVEKIVPGWNVYDNNSDARDVHGHGTNVAGVAGASSNNAKGVASVAWGCKLMPIRVTDASGYATYSALANGLTWAADHGARVANMSFIVSGSSTVSSAAKYFQGKGGVVTASSGNYGTFDSSADDPNILTVGGSGYNDEWSNSNYGNNVDLAAPIGVYTTVRDGGYVSASGTSFSAPIVAGVAALVLSVNPSLTGAQVQDILKKSADDLGAVGWDPYFGSGRVNAARAVQAASGSGVDATPPSVSFASPSANATVSGVMTVQVSASDNVGVSSVSLSVDGVAKGVANTAPYNFTYDTSAVPNGAHTFTATATDAAGNAANASITVTVSNQATSQDTVSPTVVITSPTNGSRVSNSVSVFVNAADNTGVTRNDLYVDGVLTATSSGSPFTTKWNARKASAGAHTLLCKAYDAAGNVGVSAAVTVYK